MQTGQRQTSSVPSATGTVIPASDWLATLDAAPEKKRQKKKKKTPRAQLHSLPRLKDAYIIISMPIYLVARHPINMLVYLRDGSAQTNLHAATLRLKLQIKLSTSPSHSILTPGQSIPALTL